MSTANPLRLPIADLLRRPAAARDFAVDAAVSGLATPAAAVPDDATVHVGGTLEHVPDGIVVRATIDAPWSASCSRCTQPVTGTVAVSADELFERHPLAGETYPLDDDVLDLSPLVRDALLLELPAAPLCRSDCAGICPRCGTDRNISTCACADDEPDPRWDALRALEI